MKIALIGYGKMGKAIEQIAIAKGHEIVLKINAENLTDFTAENIKKADVAIEFSTPETAFDNVKKCLENNVPVACGTTAWQAKMKQAEQIAIANNTAFLIASNFSIGVNIFFEINKKLAALMNGQPQYKANIIETHHTAKLDAPSGTAITIADGIIENHKDYTAWKLANENIDTDLPITSLRIDPAPGTHTVAYNSDVDSIELTHTAHSRVGFASGAVVAAEFLVGKVGVFEMGDVLGLGS
jgi:4-hydroxy-tetrahydrodipicolinate reductase